MSLGRFQPRTLKKNTPLDKRREWWLGQGACALLRSKSRFKNSMHAAEEAFSLDWT